MGSFGTGFLSALGDTLHQRASQARDQELKQKELAAQYHWGALQAAAKRGGQYIPDPNDPSKTVFKAYTPEDYQHMLGTTMDNLTKAYGSSKPVKDMMQRAQHLIGQVTGHPLWGMEHRTDPGQDTSQDAQPNTSPAPAAPAAPQATSLAIPPPPASSPAAASSPMPALTPSPADGGDGKPVAQADTAASTPAPSAAAAGPTDGMQASDQIEGSMAAAPPTPDPTTALAGPAPRTNAAVTPDVAIPATAAPAAPIAHPHPGAGLTPQQMLSSFQSPFDQARMQQDIGLQQNQRLFQLQQAQNAEKIKNLGTILGREPTSDEVLMTLGLKFPGGYGIPHYDSKLVMGDNLPENGVLVDGSKPDPAKAYQQMAFRNGQPIFTPASIPVQYDTIGNHRYAKNGLTGEIIGPVSDEPVKLPTQTSSISPLNYLGPNGWGQLPGHRSSAPGTGALIQGGRTPSAPGSAPSAGPAPRPGPTPAAALAGSGGAAPRTSARTSATTSPQGGSAPATPPRASALGGRLLPPGTIPAAQVQGQQKRDTSINVAGQGLQQFAQPHEDGLSNLDIFKDPVAVKRIAQYLNLNNSQIEGDFNQAEKGGAEGILSFYAGLPQAYKSISNQAVQDAYTKLSAHDKQFVSDYYNLIGQWGGMRSATGASASKYSFQNLAQEIPNPMAMSSYTQARQKVANMLHELQGIAEPNTSIRPYNESEILPPKTSSKVVPPPPGTRYSVGAPDGSTHFFNTKAEADKFRTLLKQAQAKGQ